MTMTTTTTMANTREKGMRSERKSFFFFFSTMIPEVEVDGSLPDDDVDFVNYAPSDVNSRPRARPRWRGKAAAASSRSWGPPALAPIHARPSAAIIISLYEEEEEEAEDDVGVPLFVRVFVDPGR